MDEREEVIRILKAALENLARADLSCSGDPLGVTAKQIFERKAPLMRALRYIEGEPGRIQASLCSMLPISETASMLMQQHAGKQVDVSFTIRDALSGK